MGGELGFRTPIPGTAGGRGGAEERPSSAGSPGGRGGGGKAVPRGRSASPSRRVPHPLAAGHTRTRHPNGNR